jgi:hypothetical protein
VTSTPLGWPDPDAVSFRRLLAEVKRWFSPAPRTDGFVELETDESLDALAGIGLVAAGLTGLLVAVLA